MNLLDMLGNQLSVPEIRINASTLQEPAVNVDLILDVGNSHTCGILVEDHADESNGLKQTYELQLRDLGHPTTCITSCLKAGLNLPRPNSASRTFPLKAGATMPLSGRPLPASAVKPAEWRCCVRGGGLNRHFQPAALSVG